MGFFQVLQNMIKRLLAIPERIINAGDAVGDIGSGIVNGIIGSIQSAFASVAGILRAAWDIVAMIFRYIDCTITFIINLPYCFVSHVITLVAYVSYYLFLLLPIIIIRIGTGFDLKPSLDQLVEALEAGDEILYGLAGFRLLQMPPSIINRCYKCRGKIMTYQDVYDDLSIFTLIGNRLGYVFKVKIPGYMKESKEDFESARDNFAKVIAPI
jgi:hypothetical protein